MFAHSTIIMQPNVYLFQCQSAELRALYFCIPAESTILVAQSTFAVVDWDSVTGGLDYGMAIKHILLNQDRTMVK